MPRPSGSSSIQSRRSRGEASAAAKSRSIIVPDPLIPLCQGWNCGYGVAVKETNKRWRRTAMPVFILWAIPAVIVIGGGAYWIMHLH
jgi:hypothetical protein